MTQDIALIYMVAGISSRFHGKIKQFAKVGPNEENMIEYSLKQALPARFTKIIFIVGTKTEEPFRKLFGDSYMEIPVFYAQQHFDPNTRDRPWGTVDALCSAKDIIDCPFVVCNGDDLYGKNAFRTLVNHLRVHKEAATIGYQLINVLPETGKTNRGIFQIDPNNNIKTLTEVLDVEKSDLNSKGLKPDDLCSMNIFGLHPETLHLLNSKLESFKEKHKEDRKKECLLPNELSKLINKQQLVMRLYLTKDQWFGITNPEDEEIVREALITSQKQS
ncbi:MAG: sugar phosphate nucleotidyltransferase [Candidatus Woesearchaeota archaeon]